MKPFLSKQLVFKSFWFMWICHVLATPEAKLLMLTFMWMITS